MKVFKVSFIMLVAALLTFGLYSTSNAFHSGGVAECEGCHTMHNSLDGAQMDTDMAQYQAGPYLLQGTDQASACLNCHQHEGDTGPSSYHISTAEADMPTGIAPLQRTPGGDFGWIKKTYTFVVRNATLVNEGDRHGHNIIAADFSYNADATITAAPGGTYPASSLYCSSCHDPHGKLRRNDDGSLTTTGKPIRASGSYSNSVNPDANFAVGVYRLLGGNTYSPASMSGANPFTVDPPATVAPSTYNRTEGTTDTRVAYGKGMSEWCSNCHSSMLENSYTSGMAGLTHPTGDAADLNANASAGILTNYTQYVKSGSVGGGAGSGYWSLVPVEEGAADHSVATYTGLKANAVNTGLTTVPTDPNVNCLSCHRAHASGFASMLRFAHENEFMTILDTATGNAIYPTLAQNAAVSQGLTPTEQQAAYYDRPATKFAPFQRLLCNKCHAKD